MGKNEIENDGILMKMKREQERRSEIMKNCVSRQEVRQKKLIDRKKIESLNKIGMKLDEQHKNWFADEDKRKQLQCKL